MKSTATGSPRPSLAPLACLAGIILLAGCASLSENECHTADWRMIGYEDGAAGRHGTQLGKHRKACAEHGVTPDLQAYRTGRDEGLSEYCRPRQAYQLGRSGKAYPTICPPALKDELRHSYDEGRRYYDQQMSIRQTQQDLARSREELKDIQHTLTNNELEMVRRDTTWERRLELLAEIRDLSKLEVALEDEIITLEYELVEKRARLKNLQSYNQ